MKFFAPTEEPVQIALITGHTCIVTAEGTELEPRFQKDAIAMGCTPEGVERAAPEVSKPGFDREEAIRKAIKDMVANPQANDFRNDGTPSASMVSKYVGFQALRTEVGRIWFEMQQE